MKISDLIKLLEQIKTKNGDLEVKVQTLSHIWTPDVEVRRHEDGKPRYVLLNS
jgi:hypothetical protein